MPVYVGAWVNYLLPADSNGPANDLMTIWYADICLLPTKIWPILACYLIESIVGDSDTILSEAALHPAIYAHGYFVLCFVIPMALL